MTWTYEFIIYVCIRLHLNENAIERYNSGFLSDIVLPLKFSCNTECYNI